MCVLLYFKKRENVRDTRNNKERQSSLSTNPNRTQKSLSRFSLTFIHIYSTRTILFLFSSRINRSMIIPYIHVCRTPACQKLPKTSSQDQSKTIVRWRNEQMIDRNNRCCLGEQKPPSEHASLKKNRPLSPTTTSTTSLFNSNLHRQRLWLESNNVGNIVAKHLSLLPKKYYFLVEPSRFHQWSTLVEEGAKFETRFKTAWGSLSFSLFLYFKPRACGVVTQDSGYLALHKRPWHLAVCQWTFLSTWAINLKQLELTRD